VKVGVGSVWGAAAAKLLSPSRPPPKSKPLTCIVKPEMLELDVLVLGSDCCFELWS
jgi:hypothetical protein